MNYDNRIAEQSLQAGYMHEYTGSLNYLQFMQILFEIIILFFYCHAHILL